MRQRSLAHLVLLALVLAACAPSTAGQLEANKALAREFVAALNAADWDRLDDLLTEDFQRHSQATTEMQVNSRAEFYQLQQLYLASFPDQRVTVEMMIAEGDKVAAYATYAGTNTGPLGDNPATGRSAELQFLSIFRVEDGKIAELWVEWDNVAMLTQLGLFPPPAPAGGG
ncbi:MAG: ester cyclase [Gemmatimonadales bacterium]|nr:ester cyclase [Gemmatimonadales bacterium]